MGGGGCRVGAATRCARVEPLGRLATQRESKEDTRCRGLCWLYSRLAIAASRTFPGKLLVLQLAGRVGFLFA